MILDWLLQPFSYAFMQRGLVVAITVGILCAVIGCYVVLRSMAFLGDALAHAILPGVAVAYLVGGNLLLGALAAAIVVALGIAFLSRDGTIKEDTAIGVLFAAALSLGVALISSIRTYAVDLSHILFGNILGVSPSDMLLVIILSVIVLAILIALYRPFMIVSFDPTLAQTLRLPGGLLRNVLLILLAVTIVISMQTVGIGLVAAMLVTPSAAAHLLTRRLPAMMALSGLFGAVSSLAGLYASYYLNIASGAAIVLAATVIFLLAFFFSPQRGLVWNYFRSRSYRKSIS
ncbi:MAG TPA: metal ABC transporter permease [Anaerolineaceae bacterium]|jgi:manganese/iron transport system permease protein